MSNLTKKQIEHVQTGVQIATKLDDLLYRMEQFCAEHSFMGDLDAAGDDVWSNGDIQHTSAADMVTFNGRLAELLAWFGADYRRDILREIRR